MCRSSAPSRADCASAVLICKALSLAAGDDDETVAAKSLGLLKKPVSHAPLPLNIFLLHTSQKLRVLDQLAFLLLSLDTQATRVLNRFNSVD